MVDDGLEAELRVAARRMSTHTGPVIDADDLMQEALIALIGRDDEPASLRFTIARRAMVNHLRSVLGRFRDGRPMGRSAITRNTTSYDAWQTDGELISDPAAQAGWTTPSLEDSYEPQEALRRTFTAIAALTVREQDAVLTRVRGVTLEEVGDLYGVTQARVCQVRQVALARMLSAMAA